jgi:1,4-alpha-glucan branching enzyme
MPTKAAPKQGKKESAHVPQKKGAPRAKEAHASPHPGMGPVVVEDGVSFRVWAPNADAVYLAGTFNDWSKDAAPLGSDGNGYWSVFVKGAKPGDQYKYRIVNEDLDLWRNDPYARELTSSVGESIVHNPAFAWDVDDDYRMPPWNELVIYELHIGTFAVPEGQERGSFDTAIERLGYLSDLGVNAVLVMPPMEFAGDVSWGYNPAHPFAVESSYGGPEAFKRFVKAAHEHGVAVLLDVVYNHLGPSDIDLWQFDGWSENNMGGIYFYQDWKANTPWGDTRPDYGRHEVREFIVNNAMMWLEDYRVDGLRFDGSAYIRSVKGVLYGDDLPDGWNLLRWVNDEIDRRQPWKITIAEDLRNEEIVTTPTADGGAGFDAQWDAAFVHPVREAIITQDDVGRNVMAVANAIGHRYNGDAFKRVIYTESHDEVANGKARVPEEIWPENAGSVYAKKRSTLGAALVFTAPGIPMIFQGQEFLEDGWFEDQKPLDWAKLERFPGIHALYRDLFRLRRNWESHTRGLSGQGCAVTHVNVEAKILAFQRWHEGGPGDSVMVVANLTAQPWENYWIGLPDAGLWQVRFNSDWEGYDPEFDNFFTPDVTAIPEGQDGLPAKGAINLGPYSVVILSQ